MHPGHLRTYAPPNVLLNSESNQPERPVSDDSHLKP